MRIGVALKIDDGTTRASECVIASILVRLGVLNPQHPVAQRYGNPRLLNRRGLDTGQMRPVPGLFDSRRGSNVVSGSGPSGSPPEVRVRQPGPGASA